jgi:hypothetical protein
MRCLRWSLGSLVVIVSASLRAAGVIDWDLTSWFHGFADAVYWWWWCGLVEDGEAGWIGKLGCCR